MPPPRERLCSATLSSHPGHPYAFLICSLFPPSHHRLHCAWLGSFSWDCDHSTVQSCLVPAACSQSEIVLYAVKRPHLSTTTRDSQPCLIHCSHSGFLAGLCMPKAPTPAVPSTCNVHPQVHPGLDPPSLSSNVASKPVFYDQPGEKNRPAHSFVLLSWSRVNLHC